MFTTATQIIIDCYFDVRRKIEYSCGAWNIPVCYNPEDIEKIKNELECELELPQYIYVDEYTFQHKEYFFEAHKKDSRIYLGALDTAPYQKIALVLRPNFVNCLARWDDYAIRTLENKKSDPLTAYVGEYQIDSNFYLVHEQEAKKSNDKHKCFNLFIKGGTVNEITMVGSGSVINEGGFISGVKVYKGKLEITSGGTAHGINENGGEIDYDNTCKVDFARNFVIGNIIDEGHFTIHHRTTFDHCEIMTSGEVFSGGLIMDSHIGSNGRVTLNTNATMRDVVITDGGYVDASADRCATRHILVSSGGEIALGNHTRLSDITICSGGCVYMPSFMKEKYLQHITVEDGGRVSEVLDAKPDEKEQAKKDLKDEVEKCTQEALANKNPGKPSKKVKKVLGKSIDSLLKKDPPKQEKHILFLAGTSDKGYKEWTDDTFWCTVRCNINAIYLCCFGGDYLLAYERSVVRYSPSTHRTYITLVGLHLICLSTNDEVDLNTLKYCDYVYSIEHRDQKNPIYNIDTIELDAKKLYYRKDLAKYHSPYKEKIKADILSISASDGIDRDLVLKGKSNTDGRWLSKLTFKTNVSGKELHIKCKDSHVTYDKFTHEFHYKLHDWKIFDPAIDETYPRDIILKGKITDIWVVSNVPDDFAMELWCVYYKNKRVDGPPYVNYHVDGEVKHVQLFNPNHERREPRKIDSSECKDPGVINVIPPKSPLEGLFTQWKNKRIDKEIKVVFDTPHFSIPFNSQLSQRLCGANKSIYVDGVPVNNVQVREVYNKELSGEEPFVNKCPKNHFNQEPQHYCSSMQVVGSSVSNVSILEGGTVVVDKEGYIDNVHVYPGGCLIIKNGIPYGHIYEHGGYVDFDGCENYTVNPSTTKHLTLNNCLTTFHKGSKARHLTIVNTSKVHVRGYVYDIMTENENDAKNEIHVYDGGEVKAAEIRNGSELIAHRGSRISYIHVKRGGTLTLWRGTMIKHIVMEPGSLLEVEKGIDMTCDNIKENLIIKKNVNVFIIDPDGAPNFMV